MEIDGKKRVILIQCPARVRPHARDHTQRFNLEPHFRIAKKFDLIAVSHLSHHPNDEHHILFPKSIISHT